MVQSDFHTTCTDNRLSYSPMPLIASDVSLNQIPWKIREEVTENRELNFNADQDEFTLEEAESVIYATLDGMVQIDHAIRQQTNLFGLEDLMHIIFKGEKPYFLTDYHIQFLSVQRLGRLVQNIKNLLDETSQPDAINKYVMKLVEIYQEPIIIQHELKDGKAAFALYNLAKDNLLEAFFEFPREFILALGKRSQDHRSFAQGMVKFNEGVYSYHGDIQGYLRALKHFAEKNIPAAEILLGNGSVFHNEINNLEYKKIESVIDLALQYQSSLIEFFESRDYKMDYSKFVKEETLRFLKEVKEKNLDFTKEINAKIRVESPKIRGADEVKGIRALLDIDGQEISLNTGFYYKFFEKGWEREKEENLIRRAKRASFSGMNILHSDYQILILETGQGTLAEIFNQSHNMGLISQLNTIIGEYHFSRLCSGGSLIFPNADHLKDEPKNQMILDYWEATLIPNMDKNRFNAFEGLFNTEVLAPLEMFRIRYKAFSHEDLHPRNVVIYPRGLALIDPPRSKVDTVTADAARIYGSLTVSRGYLRLNQQEQGAALYGYYQENLACLSKDGETVARNEFFGSIDNIGLLEREVVLSGYQVALQYIAEHWRDEKQKDAASAEDILNSSIKHLAAAMVQIDVIRNKRISEKEISIWGILKEYLADSYFIAVNSQIGDYNANAKDMQRFNCLLDENIKQIVTYQDSMIL